MNVPIAQFRPDCSFAFLRCWCPTSYPLGPSSSRSLSLLVVAVAISSIALRHIAVLDIVLNTGDTGFGGQLIRLLLQQAVVVYFQRCNEMVSFVTNESMARGLLTCREGIPGGIILEHEYFYASGIGLGVAACRIW